MENYNKTAPLASIVVLTCNRKKMVIELLYHLYRQSLINHIEIIVVDNGSSDGTSEAIATYFPDIVLVKNPDNIGCAGRNYGMQRASSEIIITLDDDVFLHRDDEVERIVNFFIDKNDSDAVNFKILFPHNKQLIPFNWFHPRSPTVFQNHIFETDYISEGAVAFRKHVFDKIGYYSQDFFISHEGPDLALRMLDAGMTIMYSGGVEVLHKCSVQQRTSWRNTYYDTRNYIWLLYRHWPIWSFVAKSVLRLLSSLVFALSRKQLIWYFRAVRDAYVGLPKQHKQRKPLQQKTLKRLRHIHRFQPPYFLRIKNHLFKVASQNKQY